MNISHFDNMDSDSDSEVEGEEVNQILYDIVTYKEWEQDPEVPWRSKSRLSLKEFLPSGCQALWQAQLSLRK